MEMHGKETWCKITVLHCALALHDYYYYFTLRYALGKMGGS
jgi:hypothetical protein